MNTITITPAIKVARTPFSIESLPKDGPTVRSWVGTGPNEPISPDDVHKTLGPDLLRQLSEKSGLSVQELTQKLSQVLPQAVDKLTPDGTIPKP